MGQERGSHATILTFDIGPRFMRREIGYVYPVLSGRDVFLHHTLYVTYVNFIRGGCESFRW